MDRLWTPWRYAYISGETAQTRSGVPQDLADYPDDRGTVFLNLIGAVKWAIATGFRSAPDAEKAGGVILQAAHNFVCLNAFPYSSGHLMIVPYVQADFLAKLPAETAMEMMELAQRLETTLREVYRPDGINLGMNLGQAAGAGVADHLHLHMLPRWFGDTNFMTVTAETRILPESLDVTWTRLRKALMLPTA